MIAVSHVFVLGVSPEGRPLDVQPQHRVSFLAVSYRHAGHETIADGPALTLESNDPIATSNQVIFDSSSQAKNRILNFGTSA